MNLDPIDSLRLMDRINAICFARGSIAMSLFLVFIVLVIAVDKILARLPAE